ncbi:hypothetical protein BU15DRAFT_50481 [Melanogaster broomeanus]|nr:hypothetical protein BU15DRAFT_50481 [Melanogaster broomeanus]
MQSDIELLIQQLQDTSLSGLVSDKTITSDTHLQHGTAHPISPMKNSSPLACTIQPKTSNEVLLLTLLHESEAANITLKRRVIELQAANVLNEMYCNMLRGQLAKQEEKGRKGKGKGKLMGDGLPRLLSSDEFYEKVVVCEEAQKKAVAEKKLKKAEREQRAEALVTWKKLEEKRKIDNKARRAEYHAAMQWWREVKAVAKAEKRKFNEEQPRLGKLPQAIPRPTIDVQEEDDEGDDSGEEEIVVNEDEDSSEDERDV